MTLEPNNFEKRRNEVAKYTNTLFDGEAAKESNYAILGGEDHNIINESIIRVFAKISPHYNKIITSKEFIKSKEEQESYKQDPLEYSTSLTTAILIKLLKDDGYLVKNLGDTKTNKLYDEFCTFDSITGHWLYNSLSTLSCCLIHAVQQIILPDIPFLSQQIQPTRSLNIVRSLLGYCNDKRDKLINALIEEYNEKFIVIGADDLLLIFKIINLGQTAKINMIGKSKGTTIEFITDEKGLWQFLRTPGEKTDRKKLHRVKKNKLEEVFRKQNIQIPIIKKEENDEISFGIHPLYRIDKIVSQDKFKFRVVIDLSPLRQNNDFDTLYTHIDLDEVEEENKHIMNFLSDDNLSNRFDGKYKIKRSYGYLRRNQIFLAVALKLNILLKHRYYNGNNNMIEISYEDLIKFLGKLDKEIIRVLKSCKFIDKKSENPEKSKIYKKMLGCLLDLAFLCNIKLGVINSSINKNNKYEYPRPSAKKGQKRFIFKVNGNYFNKKPNNQKQISVAH
jgi:hypothetical protein